MDVGYSSGGKVPVELLRPIDKVAAKAANAIPSEIARRQVPYILLQQNYALHFVNIEVPNTFHSQKGAF